MAAKQICFVAFFFSKWITYATIQYVVVMGINMRYILIFVCIFVIVLLGVYVYRECTAISVTEYAFASDKLKRDEYNIVMLSDLHETVHGRDNEEVFRLIDAIHPDAVFFAGDMITGSDDHPLDYTKTLSFIRRIRDRYPLYYGIGNHEEKLKRNPPEHIEKWNYYTGELSKLSVHILLNEKVYIEEAGIVVYGLDLENKYYRKIKDFPVPDGYLEGIFGAVERDFYSILIAHLPDQFTAYAKWGPDLVLSGHSHGGIIRLPFIGGLISPQLKLFPKYDAGLFREGDTAMVLSRGIGTHTIPLRINNRAEIVHIKLKKQIGDRQKV